MFFLIFSFLISQLGGFFAVVSTAMWLDKASFGTIESVASHLDLYHSVFSVMAAVSVSISKFFQILVYISPLKLEIPWAILVSPKVTQCVIWLNFHR